MSVEYDARASSGISVWVMYVCHVGWTRVDDYVESLGSFWCGVFAGSKSVVPRMSIHVRNWRSEACGPMFGSLASIASVFRMCNRVSDGEVLVIVIIVLRFCVPVAHKGAKCLRKVFEYWRGLQFCRSSLSYSHVPCWHWIVRMHSVRMGSVACEAAQRLVEISFSIYSRGRLSRARPWMVLASLKALSVGSLSGFDSSASVGQWPSWV